MSEFDGWWERRTLGEKIGAGIMIALLIIGGLALLGLVTMLLWNWLMPDIFGLKTITYWQAWGLLLLSFILLKDWSSSEDKSDRKRKKHLREYLREKENSKPEENAT